MYPTEIFFCVEIKEAGSLLGKLIPPFARDQLQVKDPSVYFNNTTSIGGSKEEL